MVAYIKKLVSKEKVVVFCEDNETAVALYDKLKTSAPNTWFHFNPDDDTPQTRVLNTRMFKRVEKDAKGPVQCFVTCKVGIRGISYWPTCLPVAAFELETKCDYEQFMGRSNREHKTNIQRGMILVHGKPKTQQEFEANLKQ